MACSCNPKSQYSEQLGQESKCVWFLLWRKYKDLYYLAKYIDRHTWYIDYYSDY